MSYLDLPRVHFAGKFTTGPSTVNNAPSNYNMAQPLGKLEWNPGGSALFQLSGCTIQSAVPPSGTADTADTLVGQTLTSTDNWGNSGVAAKIVDLDPQQQMVSMLFGLQLQVGEGDNSLIVDFEPMWFEDYVASAAYQSVLVRPIWGNHITSVTLNALKASSPDLLSIKFVLGEPTFDGPPASRCEGTIVGTIGPATADEPINFVKGRLLRPVGSADSLNFGSAQVQERRLTIDLLNAIPWGGGAPDLGILDVSVNASAGAKSLGVFDYSAAARQSNAFVQDFDLSNLSEADYQRLLSSPISVGNSSQTLFAEDSSGLNINATPYVFRMEANSQSTVQIWAGCFGVDHPGLEINVQHDNSLLPRGSDESSQPQVGVAPNGTPLSFSMDPNTTDAHGYLAVTIDGGNPANVRGYIDGQVYALRFRPNPPLTTPDRNTFLSILVHDAFDLPPTWESIEPIMAQYARLYPFMKFVPLTDPVALVADGWISRLIEVFSYPIEHPHYMPVVRDLSTAKKEIILAWLRSQLPAT